LKADKKMITVQNIPDEELMIKVKNDDLDALVPLFEKYNQRLFNFFLRLCGGRETAEDLTQTVFSRVLQYRHSYNPEHKFKTWLYQMARNAHIDHYHKNKLYIVDDSEVEAVAERAYDFRGQQQLENNYQTLHEAIGLLDDDEKEIIELSRFQDLKYGEIAKITGNSEGAVRVKVHRAIKKIRKIYFQIA
jgi:RNA polymerase sigma-70 factor, ECF subfamily